MCLAGGSRAKAFCVSWNAVFQAFSCYLSLFLSAKILLSYITLCGTGGLFVLPGYLKSILFYLARTSNRLTVVGCLAI